MINALRESFIHPKDEYTPMPFWFWNDHLEENEIKRQMHDFKSKGVMGFVIHPRIGIPEHIEYLSDRFMELVKFTVEEAARLGMKVVLYDEAMYPSGSAHGMVVKDNPEYASRGLKMTDYSVNGSGSLNIELEPGEKIISCLMAEKLGEKEINRDSIQKLSVNGTTIEYNAPEQGNWSVLVFVETFSKGTIRGIHFGEDDRQKNAPASGDLLNAKAMQKFITLTHERYYSVLKEYFGNTIIAMFTDEPGILGRAGKKGLKPWTGDFLNWYLAHGNKEEDLAVLWYDAGDQTDHIRKNYKKAVNKKLELTYYKPISQWCESHQIALTGHPEKSDEIGLLKYFHIPGQDVVWRWIAPEDNKAITGINSTMGKCSADAGRHMGRRKNSNECFGCCGPDGKNWAFTAADMKWYLDWLFIRGVNLVYPHAFFYSIDGPGRSGERPPDVGPNNIWWKHYRKFSDYIKRMCYVMTDSYNTTQVAVLSEEDVLPWKIVQPLYENQIEFNYLENNMLSKACVLEKGTIQIQKQKYTVLVIEDIHMLTDDLYEKINGFTAAGGTVVLYNPEKTPHPLQKVCEINEIDQLVKTLEAVIDKEFTITPQNNNLRVSHVVKDGVQFYCLVNEGDTNISGKVYLNTVGQVEKWNTWKGTVEVLPVNEVKANGVVVSVDMETRESLILCVDQTKAAVIGQVQKINAVKEYLLSDTSSWKVRGTPNPSNTYTLFESWTNWEGMDGFSGEITYSTTFDMEQSDLKNQVWIDLGEVHEICELTINGVDVGVALWAPYRFDITKYIKVGENSIDIRVTNTLSNRMEKTSITSGLIGPVKIIMEA
jgi:hypothetical protein